jgi:hypothetical protein
MQMSQFSGLRRLVYRCDMFSETPLVSYHSATQRHNTEELDINLDDRENLKSQIMRMVFAVDSFFLCKMTNFSHTNFDQVLFLFT